MAWAAIVRVLRRRIVTQVELRTVHRMATRSTLQPSREMPLAQKQHCRKVSVIAAPSRISSGGTAPASKLHTQQRISKTDRFSSLRDDFYLYTTTIDGAFRLFTVMEDDPSWFQLAASGSTTDIGEVQAALRDSASVMQKTTPAQPFVVFGVNESLAKGLGHTRQAKRIDEEASGHDHVMWLDRRGKLSRTVLKVSATAHSSRTRSQVSRFLRACLDDHHGQFPWLDLSIQETSLLCETLIRSARYSVTRPRPAATTSI